MNTENNLLDFDWEENDFIVEPTNNEDNESKPIESEEELIEEEPDFTEFGEEKPEPKPKRGRPKKEETESEEVDEGNNDEPLTNEEENNSEPSENSIYTDVFLDLKQGGIFKHVDIEEDEDLDEQRFMELQEEEYEAEMAERMNTWATKELDQDARDFINFKLKGGNTKDFFNSMRQTSEIPKGDIDDEDYQDEVIRFQLAKEGWDSDEIEDRLEYLTSSGKKQKLAEKYEEKVRAFEESEKERLQKEIENKKELAKKNEEEFKEGLKNTISTKSEFFGFKFSDNDKRKVLDFLTKKDQKVGNNFVTGFQRKLPEVFKDMDKMILFAKLVESDFDMKDFEKQIKTKETKKLRTNIEQRKTTKSSGSGSSSVGTSLADLFNN